MLVNHLGTINDSFVRWSKVVGLALFAISCEFAVGPDTYAQDRGDMLRVDRQQLQCLIDNAEAYVELGDDVLTVVLPACPETDLLRAMEMLTVNDGGMFGQEVGDDEASGNSLASILYLRPEELGCLPQYLSASEGDVVVLPEADLCDG